MPISRRIAASMLIKTFALGMSVFSIGCAQPARQSRLLLSAATNAQNQHYILAMTEQGELALKIQVPLRAHDSVFFHNTAVFVARSPGQQFYVIDLRLKSLIETGETLLDRYFSGHGVYSKGILFLPESRFTTKQGTIGLYDTKNNYRRIGEFSSGGIEPHQIALANEQTLVVANGGTIKNAQGAIKNPKSIQSSLVFLDIKSGQELQKINSPSATLSLRHLAVATNETLIIGAQSTSQAIEPLIFSQKKGGPLTPFQGDEALWLNHAAYTASLSINGDTVLVTSPRGNSLSIWSLKTGVCKGFHTLRDCAGTAALTDPLHFWVSSGAGVLQMLEVQAVNSKYPVQIQKTIRHHLAWDNHLNWFEVIDSLS